MVYTGTIVAEAEMTFFAGEMVDATGNVEANHNYLAGYAEAYLSNLVQYDIKTNWATISSVYKLMFSEFAARMAAISLIGYNMAAYGDRIQAEDLIKIHQARCAEIKELLDQTSVQDFMKV